MKHNLTNITQMMRNNLPNMFIYSLVENSWWWISAAAKSVRAALMVSKRFLTAAAGEISDFRNGRAWWIQNKQLFKTPITTAQDITNSLWWTQANNNCNSATVNSRHNRQIINRKPARWLSQSKQKEPNVAQQVFNGVALSPKKCDKAIYLFL